MAHDSSIEWTESTWNPVMGCTKVSAGCKNCYAERMANRLSGMARGSIKKGFNPGRTANYLHVINNQGHWNNTVYLDESAVTQPFSWKSSRIVFVNSMSDLFHEDVPLDFMQRVFATMNHCPQHTFQILTKRPERTAELADALKWTDNIWMGTIVFDARFALRLCKKSRWKPKDSCGRGGGT